MLLHEAQFLLYHLLGEPFVAIESIDLDGERQPGLQANVNEAGQRIEEIVVENPLLPGSAHELRPTEARHDCELRDRFPGCRGRRRRIPPEMP